MTMTTHKPKPKPKPPIHSGDWHIEPINIDPRDIGRVHHGLAICLAACNALPSNNDREALLGMLLAKLIEQGQIHGLSRAINHAIQAVDHYAHAPEPRHY